MAGQIGDIAPDFALTSSSNEQVSLGQYKGNRNVILSFHVFNFTSG